LEGNTFLEGKDCSFLNKFKTNFSGHNKILGAQKSWGALPPNAPLATGLLVKQKFRTGMKILLHHFLVKKKQIRRLTNQCIQHKHKV